LTVQLVSDRTLFSQSIPPPRAVPDELTRLLLRTESVIVAVPPVVLRPPPADVAWLLLIVLEATIRCLLGGQIPQVPGCKVDSKTVPPAPVRILRYP
jgi:hypothetical protein